MLRSPSPIQSCEFFYMKNTHHVSQSLNPFVFDFKRLSVHDSSVDSLSYGRHYETTRISVMSKAILFQLLQRKNGHHCNDGLRIILSKEKKCQPPKTSIQNPLPLQWNVDQQNSLYIVWRFYRRFSVYAIFVFFIRSFRACMLFSNNLFPVTIANYAVDDCKCVHKINNQENRRW